MVENGDGKIDVDIENVHACVFLRIYPLGLHVLGVTSTLFTALHEWRKSTVARWLKWKGKKKKKKRKRGPTSTLPHMAPLDVGTVFTVTFLEDKVELNNMSSLFHISPKHTLRHLNVCLPKET